MKGARILVTDDEMLSRDVLVRMLGSRGFHVDTVNDGPACMAWLERDLPDLVLLDVAMPDMSGIEVVKWIRQRQPAELLPVILVSALIDSEDVVAGLEAGANDYVLKPVNMPVLLARIKVSQDMKQSVERLIEAERHREKLQALAVACEHLGEPMEKMVTALRDLIDRAPPEPQLLRGRLGEILDLAKQADDLLARFRKVAEYRTVPYTQGIGSLVSATLQQATKANGEPHGPDSRRRRQLDKP